MKNKINIKKVLLIIFIAVAIIVGIVFIINKVVEKIPGTPEIPGDESPIIELPNTTYSNMEVKNIHMEYLKDNNQTVIRFDILNTTSNKVQKQFFTSVLIGDDDEILAQMPNTYIQELEVGQQHALEVIFEGDVTATKQIKLIEK